MKKLFFSLFAIIVVSGSLFALDVHSFPPNNEDAKPRVIRIKFHGGTLCWLPGSACEGEIYIEYKTAAPKDVRALAVPKGYSLMLMKTTLFGKSNLQFAERTFSSAESDDKSTVFIPEQSGQYSKELEGFIIYGKTL